MAGDPSLYWCASDACTLFPDDNSIERDRFYFVNDGRKVARTAESLQGGCIRRRIYAAHDVRPDSRRGCRQRDRLLSYSSIDAFYGMPEWLVALVFLLLMAAVSEIGFRLGRRSRAEERTKALVPIVAGSILTFLGILLAFTMSMAVSRYDVRRRLVLEEANAIRDAYLQLRALPDPESTALQQLLRQYAENRLRVSQSALDIRKLQLGKEEDVRLQSELWSQAAALAQKNPQSVPVGSLMELLNNAFDLENSRWVAFVARLPAGVLYVVAFIGLVTVLMVGYDFGITGHRHPLSEALLIVSITAVMAVIVELDRPYSGVIRVSQQPLIDLQWRLAAPPGPR